MLPTYDYTLSVHCCVYIVREHSHVLEIVVALAGVTQDCVSARLFWRADALAAAIRARDLVELLTA